MLDDTSRKLLRIIVQFHGQFKRMPTLPELRRMSVRRLAQIFKAMKVLVDEHYIEGSPSAPVEMAYILEG